MEVAGQPWPKVDYACCVLLGIRLLLPLAGGPGAQPVAVGEVPTAPRDHLLRVATNQAGGGQRSESS